MNLFSRFFFFFFLILTSLGTAGVNLEGSDQKSKLIIEFRVLELVKIDMLLHFFHFFYFKPKLTAYTTIFNIIKIMQNHKENAYTRNLATLNPYLRDKPSFITYDVGILVGGISNKPRQLII